MEFEDDGSEGERANLCPREGSASSAEGGHNGIGSKGALNVPAAQESIAESSVARVMDMLRKPGRRTSIVEIIDEEAVAFMAMVRDLVACAYCRRSTLDGVRDLKTSKRSRLTIST